MRGNPVYGGAGEAGMDTLSQDSLSLEIIKEEIGVEVYGILKQLKSVMQQKGIQARMPFILNIQ